MYPTHFLICVLAVFIPRIWCDDSADEPPATNDQIFGQGNTCHFVYEGITLEEVVKYQTPSAKLLGVGHLSGHRLDFLTKSYLTAVPDASEEIWGIAVTVPIQEYTDFAAKDDVIDGKKVGKSVVKSVEVTVNGNGSTVDCNLLIAINQPEKVSPLPEDRIPCKYVKTDLLNVCTEYKFPTSYSDKFQNLPTKDC